MVIFAKYYLNLNVQGMEEKLNFVQLHLYLDWISISNFCQCEVFLLCGMVSVVGFQVRLCNMSGKVTSGTEGSLDGS